MTGWGIQHLITIGVTANSAALLHQSKFTSFKPIPDPTSWAVGVGVCSGNNTGNCGGYGTNWNQASAVESTFTVPSWGYTCGGTCNPSFFVETIGIAYNYVIQLAIGQWWEGASNSTSPSLWGEEIAWVKPLSSAPNNYGSYNVGTFSSSSSITMKLGYTASEWYATDGGATTWYFNGYFANVPSVTTIAQYNQVPFAFESYDTTGTDFNSLYVSVSPTVQYYTSSWHTPLSAVVVPGNAGHSAWCGSGFCAFVGGNTSVPSSYVDAGIHQRPNQISSGQVYTESNTQGYLSSCSGGTGGTHTFKAALWP